jgi:PAS domain S-box-containing protein
MTNVEGWILSMREDAGGGALMHDELRNLLDAVPGGVVHVGRDGAIESANAEALRILGYRFDDLTRSYVADFDTTTIGEDGEVFPVSEYPVSKVLATGKPQPPVTIGVRRPDGTISWAVYRAVPALDAEGRMTGAVVTFLDITERKHAEEELRRRENQWRSLAENLPDFVIITDRAARIQSINWTLPEFELTRVIGSVGYSYIHADHIDDWKRHHALALETMAPTTCEVRAPGAGGVMRWYQSTFVPIAPTRESECVERILIVATDITERRRLLATLTEKDRLASVGLLSASVAHEIMNPLTSLLANLGFALREPDLSPRARHAIEEAREGATRMQQIVSDLRALGRSGTEELLYVDLRSVVETALRLAGPTVAPDVAVSIEIGGAPAVLASESRLCQVFLNLLVNAAQAVGARAGGERAIRIQARMDGGAHLVGVEVSDTGCGIPREQLDQIYEPLFTTKPDGTGLGLSISKRIIEAMGGNIDVLSSVGVGTTFTVWIPTTRI